MKQFNLLIFLMVGVLGFGQNAEVKIPWKDGQKLTWEEFQGQPDASVDFSAYTNSGISFSWALKSKGGNTEFIYEVDSFFYPELSWVKEERSNAHLLAHEQIHFDITELFARKLKEDMGRYKIGRNIKSDLNNLYKKRERERREMQKRFDRESQHGIKKEVQAKWEEYVRLELEKSEIEEVSGTISKSV